MLAFFYIGIAYILLPVGTLYTCFSAIYLLDFYDPDFLQFLLLWTPGIFLYYIYIGQLIIGQRLPFLDRIWGFPNLVRKHRGLFRYTLLITLVIHSTQRLYYDGIAKILWEPDIGLMVVYLAIAATIVLIILARYVWLKPPQPVKKQNSKQASYGLMHRLHQLFYLIAIGIWYHVVTAGAFQDNFWGKVLVSSYLLFAFSCKLYMLWVQRTAPVYQLVAVEKLHKSFTRLTLHSPLLPTEQAHRFCNRRTLALQNHDPSQYAYFTFPVFDKKGKRIWEQHPFSFASYAPADSIAGSSILTIIVKQLGDFSSRIADFQPGIQIRVLGPYGTFSHAASRFTGAVHLIATGIGITPFLSMLQHRAANTEGSAANVIPLRLHWFVRESEELVFDDSFAHFLQKIPMLQIHTYVGKFLTEAVFQEMLTDDLKIFYPKELGLLYCGSPIVRPALRRGMSGLGIPRRNLHSELFSI